jgi:hypothetical protein
MDKNLERWREKEKDFSPFKDKPIIVQVSHIDL